MELIKQELNVPKETKEVIDLLDAVFEQIKAKSDIAGYMSLIDELYAAAQGFDQVDDELKSKNKADAMAYLVFKIGGKF